MEACFKFVGDEDKLELAESLISRFELFFVSKVSGEQDVTIDNKDKIIEEFGAFTYIDFYDDDLIDFGFIVQEITSDDIDLYIEKWLELMDGVEGLRLRLEFHTSEDLLYSLENGEAVLCENEDNTDNEYRESICDVEMQFMGEITLSNIEQKDELLETLDDIDNDIVGWIKDFSDDISNNFLKIDYEDVNCSFDELIDTLYCIAKQQPNLCICVWGFGCNVWENEEYIEYKVTYKEDTFVIETSDICYRIDPYDYDDFVDMCNRFKVKEIPSYEKWDNENKETEKSIWIIAPGQYVCKKLEYNNKKIIN